MDLLAYFRVIRRRWFVILTFIVLGGVLGAASTLLDSGSPKARTFYKATNTLVLDPNTGDSSQDQSFSSVEQVAVLVTTGDVPGRVAKELGTTESGRQLAGRIVTLTDSVPSTLAITAVGANPRQTTRIADEFGTQLIASLDERALDRYNARRDSLTAQVAKLKSQADAYLAELNVQPRPPDFDTIQKQYDATQNRYYDAFSQLDDLQSAGPRQSKLSSLQSAQAVPIGEGEYNSRLSLAASGQNRLRAETSAAGGAAVQVSGAGQASFSSPVARGILGAFLGLLAGIGLALVSERLDHRIRTREDAETAFGLPVLAEVPRFTRAQQRDSAVVAQVAPLSRAAEAYRAVRTSLIFQMATTTDAVASGHANGNGNGAANGAANGANGSGSANGIELDDLFDPKQHERLVIMVNSASPREGKTNTSANLAAVFAEAGASVLIVNCDFRRPSIHKLLQVEDRPRTVQDTSIPGVKIVTNVLADVTANPAQVVAAQRQVIAAALQRFEVIILDTAPILTANDAIEVVGSADIVLLVARADMTTSDKAERTMEILTRLEAPVGGVVLIGSSETTNDYYYYYQRSRVQSSRRRASKGVAPAVATPAVVTPSAGAPPPQDAIPRTAVRSDDPIAD